MEKLLSLVQTVNSYLSDYVLMILLVGTGIFFTVRTKLIQRHLFYRKDLKKVIGEVTLNGKRHDSGISSFQALCAAVAAQVGTGNIVGASGAILAGGPGAIFWMWIVAVLGMSTIYAEAVLAQETRIKLPDGEILGGPVYYIKRAFPNLFGTCLAVFFACAVIVSLGFIGNMVQANSIGETLHTAVPFLNEKLIGVIIALLAFAIFAGGIKRIAVVTEKMVPFMALLYIIGGVVILACRIQYIPETFACIFKYAFNPEALIGGGLGYALKTAVSQGVKRGLFSNEAQRLLAEEVLEIDLSEECPSQNRGEGEEEEAYSHEEISAELSDDSRECDLHEVCLLESHACEQFAVIASGGVRQRSVARVDC